MATLTTRKGLDRVESPAGAAGQALTDNFDQIADQLDFDSDGVLGSPIFVGATFRSASATASEGSEITGRRSRGTVSTPTAVADNDVLLNIDAEGHDGTNYVDSGASIDIEVDGAVSTGTVSGGISLKTNDTERIFIAADGSINISGAISSSARITADDFEAANAYLNAVHLHAPGGNGIHIESTGTLTGDRDLHFDVGDANRTITLSGSPTLGDWFDQAVKTDSSVQFGAVTATVDDATVTADGSTQARDLSAWAADWKHVLRYGASVNSTSLQAAIDDAESEGGGIVLVPPGTHAVDATVNLKDHVTLMGLGKPLFQMDSDMTDHFLQIGTTTTTGSISSGSRSLTVADASDFAVGKVVSIEAARGATGAQATTLSSGITDSDTSITLDDVTGLSSSGGTMLIGGSEVVTYTGISTNTLTGVSRGQLGTTATSHSLGSAADITGVLYAQVESISGTTITLDATASLAVSSATVTIGKIGVTITGLRIQGNRDLASPTSANPFPVYLDHASRCEVTRNLIWDGDHGGVFVTNGSRGCVVTMNGFYDHGIPGSVLGAAVWLFNGAERCSVIDNEIWGNTNYGIFVDDRSTSANGFNAFVERCTVARNDIDMSRSDNASSRGIVARGCSGVRIAENSVFGAGGKGIDVANSAQGTVTLSTEGNSIADNTCKDCGIGIESFATGNTWHDNVLINCSTPTNLSDSGSHIYNNYAP